MPEFVDMLKNEENRFYIGLILFVLCIAAAIMVGGVILNAVLITIATYFGTMFTLWRFPNASEYEKKQGIKRFMYYAGLVKEWLFEHDLVLTILLGFMATAVTGISSVTGITCLAMSSLLGDLFVRVFKDCTKWWETNMKVA